MVELIHISKRFGKQVVLADVSLRIKKGQILCLFGPSGYGKTTILEIIAGVLPPDSGYRRIQSERIGYVFQDDCLIPWKTVEENLLFALSSYFPEQEARQISLQWLEKFGLYEFRHKKPFELSGGMKRRVNIARGLAIKPDLLLLDEPFVFLDAKWGEALAKMLSEVNRIYGTTIILVSHTKDHLSHLDYRVIEVKQTPIRI